MTIEIKGTEWNLKHFFESDDDPKIKEKRKHWENSVKTFVKKWKDRSDYLEKPEVLKEALDEFEELNANYGKATDEHKGSSSDEHYYFWLQTELDQNDPNIKARFSKVDEFAKMVENQLTFFALNLAKIGKEKQNLFLSDSSLENYKHYLEKLFSEGDYLLSEEAEKVMSLKSTGAHSMWTTMVSSILAKEEAVVLNEEGNEEKKTYTDLGGLLQSRNKDVRESAGNGINDILSKHVDVAVSELNAILHDKKVNDELRGFERPDTSRHISDDIDTEVIDALVDTVSIRFDLSKKFYAFKAKLLGLDKLSYYDRPAEYGNVTKKYTYEESVQLVYKVFNRLDPDFASIMKMFVEGEQIDVFPRKGKWHGAFCVHFLKSQPTFILLNHMDKLRCVTTLAHELGHGINNELMKKQHSLYFETSTATAEVASTFMEDFVFDELLKEANEEEQLALLVKKLDEDVATIMRQIACYKFEQELHKEFREKGHLSKEDIGAIFKNHMQSYLGDAVEQSEGNEHWWVGWHHIRRYFYVYSYSSGLLISKALQKKVKQDPEFITKVKEFLSAGVSKSPKDIFLDLGIDITKKEFWEAGLKEIEDLLQKTTDLAKKLGKI